jgi:hypothetical protein
MQKMLGTQLVGPKVIAFLEQTPMLRGLTQIPDSIKAAGLANPVVQTQTLPASISINPAVNPLGGQMSGRPNRRQ